MVCVCVLIMNLLCKHAHMCSSCSCSCAGGVENPQLCLGFHQLRFAVEENLKALNELTPQPSAAIVPRLACVSPSMCACVCVSVLLPPHDARTFFN